MLDSLIFVTIIISHIIASLNFWKKLKNGYIPAMTDFATIGIILFYDIGLTLEWLGLPYESQYFRPALGQSGILTPFEYVVLILAPWLLQFGSFLIKYAIRRKAGMCSILITLSGYRKRLFYALAIILCAILITLVAPLLYQIAKGIPIWITRKQIGVSWGPLIILFYIPSGVLAFYLTKDGYNNNKKYLLSIFLAVSAALISLPIGQRSGVLLPFLMLGLFGVKLNFRRLILIGIVFVALAAVMLSVFKWQYSSESYNFIDFVKHVIYGDFYRIPVITSAFKSSEWIGSKILPYPMSGYVYNIFFYIPRKIAPFKGYSTASYFTSYLVGSDVLEIDWGFGFGLVEELALNMGLLSVIPGLIMWGILMGLLDKLSSRIPAITVPSKLAGVWLIGYHLAAILLVFGSMAIIAIILQILFTDKRKLSAKSKYFYTTSL